MVESYEVRLREGRPEDFEQLLEVIQEAPGAASWADTCPVIVAECEQAIAGFVLYRLVAGEGEILNLAVRPKFRRHGIASELLQALFAKTAVWHLEVRTSNSPAIQLYRSLGFTQTGRRENYYRDGEAAILLSRSES